MLNLLVSICAELGLKNESYIAAKCKKIATENDMNITRDIVKSFLKYLLADEETKRSQKVKKYKKSKVRKSMEFKF